MLGKFDGGSATNYINQAKKSGRAYFDLGDDWKVIKETYGLTDEQMFKAFNESFLDDGINAGKTFYFSHDPIIDTGTLNQELKYLEENGYMYNPKNMTADYVGY
jgi:hypothetical protein